MELGFIGLGHMGLPMAARLLEAGHTVHGTDINTAAIEKFAALGGVVHSTPRSIADTAEVVLASLPTPAIVRQVAIGDQGVAGGGAISVFVDLSTTGQPTTVQIAEALHQHGIAMLDSPVSGGVGGAEKGTLAVMTAGPDAQFDTVRPILEVLGKVFHVGTTPGLGQTMKLVNNYLSALALAGTAEASVVGARAGLDPAVMMEVLNSGSGRNSATVDKFPRAVLPGTFDFGFATALMCKDLRLFAEQAETMGVPLWIGGPMRTVWEQLNTTEPRSDFTAIAHPYEEWAGVELRSTRAPAP